MMEYSWNILNNQILCSFLWSFQMKYCYLDYLKMFEHFEMMEHLYENVPTFLRICAHTQGKIADLFRRFNQK